MILQALRPLRSHPSPWTCCLGPGGLSLDVQSSRGIPSGVFAAGWSQFQRRSQALAHRQDTIDYLNLAELNTFCTRMKMHIQYDIFDWATKPVRFVFSQEKSYTSHAQQLGSYTDKALGGFA
ncbi:unnamed protein product [Durusdinium trenchii]|uniref:Uncharacterized protein n=1 Tax=Durusdinium trenchii TaxID=1381693 RepID=A0ABP0KY31_9DINO